MREVQLALDEMYAELVHGHMGVVALEFGYRGQCRCGWVGQLQDTKALARGSVSSHLSRTEPGARVVALLRRS